MPQLSNVDALAAIGPAPAAGTSPGRAGLIAWSIASAAVAAALAWAYIGEIRGLISTWSNDRDYSHGWLVIPVALLILWRRPRPTAANSWRPSALGWILLLASLATRSVASEMGYAWIDSATLLPAILGLALAAGGFGFVRWAWPALAFLIFMYPMPPRLVGVISQPLQSLATIGACGALRATGLWVMNEGNVIIVGSEQLEVARACNGLSMLVSLAATIVATVLLTPTSLGRRITLFLSIVPIGLLCNIIRIAATAWCYNRYGAKVGGAWAHDIAGWLMMPMAIALVFAELGILSLFVPGGDAPAGAAPARAPSAGRKPRS